MNNKGFSLIETLIAIAIFGILLTALTAFFISQNRQYVVQSQIVEMQDNARAAMDFTVRMLRNNDDHTPGITGNTCSHSLKFTDVFGNEHQFRRYSSSTDGPNTFGYHKNPDTGTIDPFAMNITCFEVLHVGNQFEIIITAETDRVLPGIGQKGSVTLESTVKPRNLN